MIGGYAVILHGHPRSTIDLDLWIEPDEANADRIREAFSELDVLISPVQANHLSAPNQLIRVGIEPHRVDLLTTLPELDFSSCWHQRKMVETGGVVIPLIDLESLRITKKASGRFQDLADLENLPEA